MSWAAVDARLSCVTSVGAVEGTGLGSGSDSFSVVAGSLPRRVRLVGGFGVGTGASSILSSSTLASLGRGRTFRAERLLAMISLVDAGITSVD